MRYCLNAVQAAPAEVCQALGSQWDCCVTNLQKCFTDTTATLPQFFLLLLLKHEEFCNRISAINCDSTWTLFQNEQQPTLVAMFQFKRIWMLIRRIPGWTGNATNQQWAELRGQRWAIAFQVNSRWRVKSCLALFWRVKSPCSNANHLISMIQKTSWKLPFKCYHISP